MQKVEKTLEELKIEREFRRKEESRLKKKLNGVKKTSGKNASKNLIVS